MKKLTLSLSMLFLYANGYVVSNDFDFNQNYENKILYKSISQIKLDGLSYLNKLRSKVNMIELKNNDFLSTSSENHALYSKTNKVMGHYEEKGKLNFTGITPPDRAIYAGYKNQMVSENISYGSKNIEASIDGLFSAIYHRFGFLNEKIDEIGIGIKDNIYNYNMGNSLLTTLCNGEPFSGYGKYYTKVCADSTFKIKGDDYDNSLNKIKSQNPKIVLWPPKNGDKIPPVFYEESPDPLPNQSVSGYPVSVMFNDYYFKTPPKMKNFVLKDSQNNTLKTTILTNNTDPNKEFTKYQFAIFPIERLEWNKKYFVEFSYLDNNLTKSIKWSFKTKTLAYPYYIIDKNENNKTFNIISDKTYAFYFKPQNGNDLLKAYKYSYTYNSSLKIGFIDQNTIWVKFTGKIGAKVKFKFNNLKELTLKVSDKDNPILPEIDLNSESNNTIVSVVTKNKKNDSNVTDKKPNLEVKVLSTNLTAIKTAKKGWTLLGALSDINMTNLKASFHIIWGYKNGKWKAYSNKTEIQEKIKNNSYKMLKYIKKGEGFWIYK